MGLWTKEDIASDIAKDAVGVLAKRLMGTYEERVATIRAVRDELNRQLTAVEDLQTPDPPADASGKKGWFLYQHEGVTLINPAIFLQVMLKDYTGRVNFSIYAQTPWAKGQYTYKGTAMAWGFNLYPDKRGDTCFFSCLGVHRCAPGDIVISDDARYVVDTVKWAEGDDTWYVHAHAPSEKSAEALFDPHANDLPPRPCGTDALKTT